MTLRRKEDLQRIRMARRNLATVDDGLAQEVVRLRRAMHRAMGQLDAGVPREARATLRVALAGALVALTPPRKHPDKP